MNYLTRKNIFRGQFFFWNPWPVDHALFMGMLRSYHTSYPGPGSLQGAAEPIHQQFASACLAYGATWLRLLGCWACCHHAVGQANYVDLLLKWYNSILLATTYTTRPSLFFSPPWHRRGGWFGTTLIRIGNCPGFVFISSSLAGHTWNKMESRNM
jgi:hypothetical protein